MTTTLILGDILKSKAQVIVNPANSRLSHGGGLAQKIAEAANRRRFLRRNTFQRECDEAPAILTGHIFQTSAGALRFKRVFHAVGPIWSPGTAGTAHEYLEEVYVRCLDAAEDYGYKSIAFPAISSGVFGVPVEIVARAAYSACLARRPFCDVNAEFWLWRAEHANMFGRVFGQRVRVVT